MTNEPNVKLLPCAHCGDKNVKLLRQVLENKIYWHVECSTCGIRTGDYEEDMSVTDSPFEAMNDAINVSVSLWNDRVGEPCKHVKDIDMSGMDNDDLVRIAKKATDAITSKAYDIVKQMSELLEENDGKH